MHQVLSSRPQFKPIRQVDKIRAEAIPDWVYSSEVPLLLKGLVSQWPLVQAGLGSACAAIELLKSHCNDKPAPIYFGEPGMRRLAYKQDLSGLSFEIKKADIKATLEEILANLDSPAPPLRYIASNAIEVFFPSLRQGNDLPFSGEYFAQHPLELADPHRGIWIGTSTISPCHYDAQSNIACVAVGQRRFTLFPPDQVHNLYPGPLELNPGGPAITLVDFDQPDYARFPRFAEAIAAGQEALLEPGDALFIPCMWWHQVESLSRFNVLVNYWWNSYPKIRGQAMNVLYHALLSIRDRPVQEKQAWKQLLDYYVFDSDSQAGEPMPEAVRGYLGKIDDAQARRLRAMLLQKLNR